MTNDEFILDKKSDKFNQAWEKLNRLFDSQKEINASNSTFRRRKTINQYFIICTRKGWPKIVVHKGDMKQAFVYNKEYTRELNETQKNLHDKKYEGNGVSYNYKKTAVDKEIMRLVYEHKYISCLLTLCGCNIMIETCTDNLKLVEIGTYIRKQDSSKISSFYYEFKHYGIKKLNFVIKTKKTINDVLPGEQYASFRKYCAEQNLQTIHELLLFPYYAKSVVEKFGAETVKKVIQMIIGMIEIVLIDVGGTNFDLTDLI